MNDKPTLHAALVAARKAIPAIPKTADNPFYSSKYAPLEKIEEAVRPILWEHGFLIVSYAQQTPSGRYELVTELRHEGGTLRSGFPLPDADSQKVGAGMTYGRRYNLVALLDLDTEPDDDGNAASGLKNGQAGQATRTAATPPRMPSAPVAATGAAWDGRTCPRCASKAIKQAKSGKNAGLFLCMPWEDKGISGCWSKWTSQEAVKAEWDRRHAAPAAVPVPAGPREEPEDDGQPFPGY